MHVCGFHGNAAEESIYSNTASIILVSRVVLFQRYGNSLSSCRKVRHVGRTVINVEATERNVKGKPRKMTKGIKRTASETREKPKKNTGVDSIFKTRGETISDNNS